MIVFRLHFPPKVIRFWLIGLSIANVVFSVGTVAFVWAWHHLADYGGIVRSLINYVLVQSNLATENVVAAWYSSMLLFAVAIGSVIAYVADTKAAPQKGFRRWLSFGWLLLGLVFAGLSLDELGSFHERLGMLSQLDSWGDGVQGWAYVMALPIAVVAIFMLAFGWLHARRVPLAFWLLVSGVVLFVSDPLFEQMQMTLLQRGAPPGSWERFVHDTLVIVEEGGLELFGGLCFLTATIVYAVRLSGGAALNVYIRSTFAIWISRAATAFFLIGIFVTHWAVAHLPPGDTGIPDNWFPAAGAFLLAVLVLATRLQSSTQLAIPRRSALGLAVSAIVVSAYFGANTYAYFTWYRFDFLRQILQTILAIAFVGICVAAAMGNSRAAWRLIIGGALVALSINVTGPHAAPTATLGAGLCAEGVLLLTASRRPESV